MGELFPDSTRAGCPWNINCPRNIVEHAHLQNNYTPLDANSKRQRQPSRSGPQIKSTSTNVAFCPKTPTAERKRKLFNAAKYEALIFTPMLKAHKQAWHASSTSVWAILPFMPPPATEQLHIIFQRSPLARPIDNWLRKIACRFYQLVSIKK